MPDFLQMTLDKFTFRVALDRWYTSEGVWAQMEGNRFRIGLSDFLQQRSGDVAFVEVKPVGTTAVLGEEIATLETIKVNISLASPVSGKVIQVNPLLQTAPECINQEPYGAGWLALIEADPWESDRAHLLEPQAYFQKMKAEAEEEK